MKLRAEFLSVAILSMLLTGCGGGGGDSTNNTSGGDGTDPGSDTSGGGVSEQTMGQIELGPVSGATVEIRTLGGTLLLEFTTDDAGFFEIDDDALRAAIENSGSQHEFVRIVSSGGTDTDPDDDGQLVVEDEIDVQGQVASVVPVQTIYESSDFRVNLISSALVDLLNDLDSFGAAEIAYLTARLGVPDLNRDGVIDAADVAEYSMLENEADIEQKLRDQYLEFVHNGDDESRRLAIDDLRYETGFIQTSVTEQGSTYEVTLQPSSLSSLIYYGIADSTAEPNYGLYLGEALTLDNDTALFYQECLDEYACFKLQKFFVRNNEIYEDNDYEATADTSGIEDSVQQVRDKRGEIEALESDMEEQTESLEQLDAEREALQAEIDSAG